MVCSVTKSRTTTSARAHPHKAYKHPTQHSHTPSHTPSPHTTPTHPNAPTHKIESATARGQSLWPIFKRLPPATLCPVSHTTHTTHTTTSYWRRSRWGQCSTCMLSAHGICSALSSMLLSHVAMMNYVSVSLCQRQHCSKSHSFTTHPHTQHILTQHILTPTHPHTPSPSHT